MRGSFHAPMRIAIVLGHFEKVHPDYAAGVRAALAKRAK